MKDNKTYDLILVFNGMNPFSVLRVVKHYFKISLKDSIAITKSPPTPILTGASKEEAEKLKKCLEEVGAIVRLKPSQD